MLFMAGTVTLELLKCDTFMEALSVQISLG